MKLPNRQRKRGETSKQTTEERRNFQTDNGREAKLPNRRRKRDETSTQTTEERRNFQRDDGGEAKLTRQELSLLRTELQIRMHEQFDFTEVITRTS